MPNTKSVMERRIKRARKKISGSPDRPRLAFKKSLKYLYAQILDDTVGKSIGLFATSSEDFKGLKSRKGLAAAEAFGVFVGKKLAGLGVKKLVFDRRGRRYHGVVKNFADAVRKAGIDF